MSDFNTVLARNVEGAPRSPFYSQSVAFSHYNHLSAQLPLDPITGSLVRGGVREQAQQCFSNIAAIVKGIGHVMNDVVRITIFVTDLSDLDEIDAVYKSFFPTYVPSRTVLAVDALPKGALVFIEALVSNGEGTIPNAPQEGDLVKLVNNIKCAPYCALSSQTVAFSHYNNVSAQLPLDPSLGRIIPGGVMDQAWRCLRNIKLILEGIDVPLDDVVKINIFLKNLEDIAAVNAIYKTFFPDSGIARTAGYLPARTVIPVADLPLHALVQIEAVVSHGDGTPPQAIEDRHGIVVEPCNTDAAPIDHLSTQSVAFSHYNNVSAQLPIDATTNELVTGGIKEQTDQCLKNMAVILQSVDHNLEDIVKVNVYLKDIEDLDAFNEVYTRYFPEGIPARRVIGVAHLPMDALVQIDAVAANAEGTTPK